MINYTLCSIKVYFRFIKDTLGLVQVVSSVVQVLSIILLVISSVVLTASRILQVVSTANKVHLSDFIEHTLHERFAPLHSCKNPPHQTPAPLCSHGRGLIIDQGGTTRCTGHGQGTPHTHWVALLAQLTQRGGFGPATQSRMRHSLAAFLHWFAHARSPGRFRPYTVCALICTSSLTWGDFGPTQLVCGRRVLRAPLPAALVYARCPAPGPATQPTESDEELSEPPFFTHAAQLQAESARLALAACRDL